MTTALKRTIMAISVIVLAIELIIFSNIAFAKQNVADAATTNEASAMTVSDVPYVPPAEVFAEQEDSVDSGKDQEVVIDETAALEETVTELDADWQLEEEAYIYEDYDYAVYDDYDDCDYIVYDENYVEPSYDDSGYFNANVNGDWHSGADFAFSGGNGYDDASGYSYTWYSENVLPGGGLDIPGRHVGDEGYVCDENGNVCLASDDLAKGTVVSIPFGSGTGVVYDSGSGYGNLDVYVSW